MQYTSVFSARAAQRKKCPHQSLFLRTPTSAPPPHGRSGARGTKRLVASDPHFFSYPVARNFSSNYAPDDFLATGGPSYKPMPPPKPAGSEDEEGGSGGKPRTPIVCTIGGGLSAKDGHLGGTDNCSLIPKSHGGKTENWTVNDKTTPFITGGYTIAPHGRVNGVREPGQDAATM